MDAPKKIAVGVRVKEKRRDSQIGIVLTAVGKAQWTVKFNGDTTEHTKSSQALTIYKAAYSNELTPPKKPAINVPRAAPQTGRRVDDEDGIECVNEETESYR